MARAKAVTTDVATPSTVTLVSTCDLMEPFTYQWFRAGVATQVSEITIWTRYQIDAGLIQQVEG